VRGRFFKIRIAAVDKSIRGTQAHYPIIELCPDDGIPIILETHNPENVGLYGHFGFEVVRTISSPDTDVEQYCMIERPRSSD